MYCAKMGYSFFSRRESLPTYVCSTTVQLHPWPCFAKPELNALNLIHLLSYMYMYCAKMGYSFFSRRESLPTYVCSTTVQLHPWPCFAITRVECPQFNSLIILSFVYAGTTELDKTHLSGGLDIFVKQGKLSQNLNSYWHGF